MCFSTQSASRLPFLGNDLRSESGVPNHFFILLDFFEDFMSEHGSILILEDEIDNIYNYIYVCV